MTPRAILTGLAMAAWVNFWPTYSTLIVHSTRADYAHLSLALLIPFILLLLLNSRFSERRRLVPSELLAICCMGMISAMMQGEGLTYYFLGTVTAPTYFADPENQWGELLLQNVAEWAIITDPEVSVGFYEGLRDTEAFPFRSWMGIAFWWGTFFAAILTVTLCMSIILRRQWSENERLAFPIASALLELTGVSGGQPSLMKHMKNRLFVTGFCVVFALISCNILSWFSEAMPALPILHGRLSNHVIQLGRGFPAFRPNLSVLTMSFGYFTESDVLLSIWFFHVLAVLQTGIYNRLGYKLSNADPYGSFSPSIGWQCFGGLITVVAWGLWNARSHLKAVFQKAVRGEGPDDSGEVLSYRAAVVLLVGCTAYLFFWVHRAGLDWAPTFVFWFGTFVLYLGMSRIIIESGLIYLRGPLTAQAFTWHIFGVSGLGPIGATAIGLTNAFFCDGKTFGAPILAHIPRLGSAMDRESRRKLVPAVLVASAIGAATVISFILFEGYRVRGSYNFGARAFNGSTDSARGLWILTANRIQQSTFGTDWVRLGFLSFGSVFVAALYLIRRQFPGFPIHPIGFTFSANGFTYNSVFSCFLIWAIKGLILRLGGLQTYRRLIPLFLGLMVGYLAGVGMGVVVDFFFFFGHGHHLITSF
tara:strand:- start:19412 stop:21349 length:1938 start_codon:yes stop_codon:yes gene_type:complete